MPAPFFSLARLLTRVTRFAGISLLILGLVVLGGWYARISPLVQFLPGLAPMMPTTALAFLLCGVALLALDTARKALARATTVAIGLIAALTLAEYLVGVDLQFSRLLVPPSPAGFLQPDRMAPNSALGFALGALALLTLCDTRLSRPRLASLFSAAITALALIALVGYADRSTQDPRDPGFTAGGAGPGRGGIPHRGAHRGWGAI